MQPVVLIVDLEPAVKNSLAACLTGSGCRVLEAGGPDEAEQMVRGHDLDVVLLDLRTLEKSVLPLMTAFREIRRNVQVVLLSSRRHIQLSIKGMKLGAFGDLMAPFDLDELVRLVYDACGRKRSLQEKQAGAPAVPLGVKAFAASAGLSGVRFWFGRLGDSVWKN